MHKTCYASGFLYHSASEQILLQQDTTAQNVTSQWLLFGGEHTEKENPEKTFQNIINKLLKIKIASVIPVYSYENGNVTQTIVYAEVDELREISPKNDFLFNWFTFKNALKLPLSVQTKHDIVVGQRVIEAASRKSRGEHTFQ
jgi:hypothetical protein